MTSRWMLPVCAVAAAALVGVPGRAPSFSFTLDDWRTAPLAGATATGVPASSSEHREGRTLSAGGYAGSATSALELTRKGDLFAAAGARERRRLQREAHIRLFSTLAFFAEFQIYGCYRARGAQPPWPILLPSNAPIMGNLPSRGPPLLSHA